MFFVCFILINIFNIIEINSQTVFSCNRTAKCGCSKNPAIISRIVGGEAADNATWGWAVSISIAGQLLCGGSILSESWIISAAHCFDGFSASDIVIHAGSIYRWAGTQKRNVSRLIMHDSYNSMTFENDIALLQLSKRLLMDDSNVKAICLPSNDDTTESSDDEWPPADTSVSHFFYFHS